MKYSDFRARESFGLKDLIAFSYGRLVDDPPKNFDARLPASPFLMVDRILSLKTKGQQGSIVAEQDILMDAWYFQCHMADNPVQSGCLCVDAIWQLLGFYCIWRGAFGSGRALGCGEVSFNGQIRPFNRIVRYEIKVKRFSQFQELGASIAIGDGQVYVDNELIGEVRNALTGVFKNIVYPDYPKRSKIRWAGS
ncbi:MAG: bifunctional 3-hydroxydecanoyl-ACP dehydratase/trans-2-decenoyl-ACP isomerase [Smithellaceae bacterium]